MEDHRQSIRLLLESFEQGNRGMGQEGGNHCQDTPSPNYDYLEIPDGTSYLAVEKSERPRLIAKPGVKTSELFVLETIWESRPPQLLVLTPQGRSLMINGGPGPPVALLREKDEVAFESFSEYVAHVTLFNRTQIGSTPDHAIGKKCPICRTSFDNGTTVYLCAGCGEPLHCEGEEQGQDRLDCARICSKCPICTTPIVTQPGYTYMPAL
jgi:hypothetical protein